ncbi:SH3 domain-containing protein [Flaviflagellibacter deserti]|uniref:SH3 domain-containing protein n=1 Tax=Flaviflagellibacter deserti TaxID=2267266 RepID=A0ABV9Z744_9HYPH
MMSPKTAVSALALFLASAGAAAAFPATATTSLNVRSGPGTNFGVVDQLQPGDTVEVTATQGSWYQVNGSGWASANYLSGGGTAAVEQPYYEDPGYDGADIAFYYGSDPYYWDDGGYYWYWRGGRRHRVDWDWFRDRDRNDFRWTDNRHRRDFDNRWRGDRFRGDGRQRIVRSGSGEFGGDRRIIRRNTEGPAVEGRGRFRGEGQVQAGRDSEGGPAPVVRSGMRGGGEGRLQTGRASTSGPAPVFRGGEGRGRGSGGFNAGRGGGGGGGAPVFRSGGGGQGRGGGY